MIKFNSKISKFAVGVLMVAVMIVGFTVVSKAKVASAMDMGATTLTVGSSGAAVSALQTSLNTLGHNVGSADGSFGPMTKAGAMAFQLAKGLSADGAVGPITKAAIKAALGSGPVVVVTTPAVSGCPAGALFNSLTGASCTVAAATVAGCTAGALFSSTTGASCAAAAVTFPAGCTSATGFSTTTGNSCSGAATVVVATGTNGYLVDLNSDSTGRVSTVYESEQDKVVAGFRATARLADQTVDRVRVTFDNTNSGNSSANLSRYISGASLWNGSTRVATIQVASADRNISTDVYTFNFTGLNSKILKDQIGRFYVSVNANGSIDSNDTNATWRVIFLSGGTSASSPDGTYDTYPSGDITTSGLAFNKFSTSGVKVTVGLAISNPTANIAIVSSTATTTGVTLLKFTIKATNSNLVLRKIPITMVSTTGAVSDIVNTLRLYQGSNLVDTVDGSTVYDFDTDGNSTTFINSSDTTIANTAKVGYLFTNLSDPYNKITAGSTVEYTVIADLKKADGVNYSEGDSLTASVKNADVFKSVAFSVQDTNGDQLADSSATVRIGSAVGEIQTLRVNGVQLTMGTASIVTTVRGGTGVGASNIVNTTYSIPVTMTSFGQTLYIPKTAAYGSDTANGAALAYGFIDASSPSTVIASGDPAVDVSAAATGPTLSSSNAATEGDAWRLDSGVAKLFTLTITLNSATSENNIGTKSLAVVLSELQTYTTSTVSGAGTEQSLLPIQSYQTGYQAINYGS